MHDLVDSRLMSAGQTLGQVGGATRPAGAPAHQGPVAEALDDQAGLLDHVAEAFSNLEARLGPILHAPETPEGELNNRALHPVALAGTLHAHNDRLRALLGGIAGIHERLGL